MPASTLTYTALGIFCCGCAYASVKPFTLAVLLIPVVMMLWKKWRAAVFLVWVFWCAGLGWSWLYQARNQLTLPHGQQVVITGTIVEAPDVRSNRTYLTFLPDNQKAKVLVSAPRLNKYRYGDRLQVTGVIQLPEVIKDFDYPRYLQRWGIMGLIRQPAHMSWLGNAPPNQVTARLYALRATVEENINKYVVEPEASFLSGLLLGSKRAIPQSIQNDLQKTGTSHLTAISGENISLMLIIILSLIPVRSLRAKWLLTCIISIAICVMTGLSSSVVRGAAMACGAAYLRMNSRKIWPIPLLIVSLSGMLLANPLQLADDPGFQLSFAAIAGLFLFSEPVSRLTQRKPFNLLPDIVLTGLCETVAALFGTLPLDLKLFGQLSLIGLIVNPIVLWLIFPVTLIGLAVITFGWIPPVSIVLALPAWLLLHAILSLIKWFALAPIGVIHVTISWWVVGCLYGLAILFAVKIRHA